MKSPQPFAMGPRTHCAKRPGTDRSPGRRGAPLSTGSHAHARDSRSQDQSRQRPTEVVCGRRTRVRGSLPLISSIAANGKCDVYRLSKRTHCGVRRQWPHAGGSFGDRRGSTALFSSRSLQLQGKCACPHQDRGSAALASFPHLGSHEPGRGRNTHSLTPSIGLESACKRLSLHQYPNSSSHEISGQPSKRARCFHIRLSRGLNLPFRREQVIQSLSLSQNCQSQRTADQIARRPWCST